MEVVEVEREGGWMETGFTGVRFTFVDLWYRYISRVNGPFLLLVKIRRIVCRGDGDSNFSVDLVLVHLPRKYSFPYFSIKRRRNAKHKRTLFLNTCFFLSLK
jgi:hypothetical protein